MEYQCLCGVVDKEVVTSGTLGCSRGWERNFHCSSYQARSSGGTFSMSTRSTLRQAARKRKAVDLGGGARPPGGEERRRPRPPHPPPHAHLVTPPAPPQDEPAASRRHQQPTPQHPQH